MSIGKGVLSITKGIKTSFIFPWSRKQILIPTSEWKHCGKHSVPAQLLHHCWKSINLFGQYFCTEHERCYANLARTSGTQIFFSPQEVGVHTSQACKYVNIVSLGRCYQQCKTMHCYHLRSEHIHLYNHITSSSEEIKAMLQVVHP